MLPRADEPPTRELVKDAMSVRVHCEFAVGRVIRSALCAFARGGSYRAIPAERLLLVPRALSRTPTLLPCFVVLDREYIGSESRRPVSTRSAMAPTPQLLGGDEES